MCGYLNAGTSPLERILADILSKRFATHPSKMKPAKPSVFRTPSFLCLNLLFLFSTFSTLSAAFPRLSYTSQPANSNPLILPRQSTVSRGWAMRSLAGECPSGTGECTGAKGMTACCPTNTKCFYGSTFSSMGRYAICCLPGMVNTPLNPIDSKSY